MSRSFPRVRRTCPACKQQNFNYLGRSVISPWVTELSAGKPQFPLCFECIGCGTVFFDIHYSEEVLSSLYENYRGNRYFSIRNKWEPTYTLDLNRGLVGDPAWLRARRLQIIESLEKTGVSFQSIESIVDFGGGHGGVMPLAKKRFLIEKSKDIVLDQDIVRLDSLEQAKVMTFDLVMCCGVLEHVNDPLDLLHQISALNSRWFLFEVPKGTPLKRIGPANSKAILRFVSSFRILWRLLQIAERKVSLKEKQFLPLRCSEHIQFFSRKGMCSLLENANFKVMSISTTEPNRNLKNGKSLSFEEGMIAICIKA